MEVNIANLVSTVRAVDDSTLLSPRALEQIVQLVMQAVRECEAHQARVRAEQGITGGVRAELEGEER